MTGTDQEPKLPPACKCSKPDPSCDKHAPDGDEDCIACNMIATARESDLPPDDAMKVSKHHPESPLSCDDNLAPLFAALRDSNIPKHVLDEATERLSQARWLEAERDTLRADVAEMQRKLDKAKQQRDAARVQVEQLQTRLLWWNEKFCCQAHAPQSIHQLKPDCEAFV